MAEVNGREFSTGLLRSVFHLLDAGGTRASVRSLIRDAQGKGVSNETVAALRDVHLRLRRSQGYALTPRQRRNIRETPSSPAKRLKDLTRFERLSKSRIPEPPRIKGVTYRQAVEYNLPQGGKEIRVFDVGDGRPPVADQVAEAQDRDGYGSVVGGVEIGGRGYAVVATWPDVEDL